MSWHRSLALPRPRSILALALVVLGATPAERLDSQEAQEDPFAAEAEWSIERFNWSGRLDEGSTVAIVNEFGDVRARASEDGRIEVSAVIQKRRDLEVEPEIAVLARDDGLAVEARFPDGAIDAELLAPGRRVDRRIDLVVFVPRGAELSVRTARGLIEAKGLTGNALLRSDRGDLVVHTTASVDAGTEHGSIAAVLRGREWSAPPRFETLTGDIRVELPKAVDVVAHISTRAEITTDYSIEIEREGLLRRATATIGEGGQELFVETNRGGVRLLESIE